MNATPYWTSGDGRHVLWCGDALEVLPTLEKQSVRLLWTDPPYGHNNQDGDLQSARVRDDVKGARKRKTVGISNDSPETMRETVSRAIDLGRLTDLVGAGWLRGELPTLAP